MALWIDACDNAQPKQLWHSVCLQTLPNASWGTKLPLVMNHWPGLKSWVCYPLCSLGEVTWLLLILVSLTLTQVINTYLTKPLWELSKIMLTHNTYLALFLAHNKRSIVFVPFPNLCSFIFDSYHCAWYKPEVPPSCSPFLYVLARKSICLLL